MVGVNHKEAKKRLQEVIVDSKSKSLRAFALSINVDPSLLAKVVGDQRTLTPAMVKAISERYKVNEDWLLYGEGEKYGQNGAPKPTQHPSPLLTGATITLQDYINELKESRDRWYNLASSILGEMAEDQRAALAYQKAWIEYEAEKAAAGDDNVKAEVMYKMSMLVRGYLKNHSSSGIQNENDKNRKA